MERKRNWFGLDADGIEKGKWMLKVLKLLTKYNNRIIMIERRMSAGRSGYHFKIWLDRKYSLKELIAIREILSDCYNRSVSGDVELYWKEDKILRYGKISELINNFKSNKKIEVLTLVPIEKICHNSKLKEIFTAKYSKVDWGRVSNVYYHGVQPVYNVKLKGGKFVEITKDHSLFTSFWKNRRIEPITFEKALKEKKEIITIENFGNIAIKPKYDLDFLTFCGLWIADGCYSKRKDFSILKVSFNTLKIIKKVFKEKYFTIVDACNLLKIKKAVLKGRLKFLIKQKFLNYKEGRIDNRKCYFYRISDIGISFIKKRDKIQKQGYVIDCIQFSVATRDIKILNFLREFAENNKIKISIRKDKWEAFTVRIWSKELAEKMAEMGFTYPKIVPKKIFIASNEEICAFLKGYFSGDGCIYMNKHFPTVTSCTILKNISYGIQILLNRLGIASTINKEERNTNFGLSIVYVLKIIKRAYVIKFLNLIKLMKADKYYKIAFNKQRNKEKHYLTRNILKVTEAGLKPVYDLEVNPSQSFVANGILCHNTKADRQRLSVGNPPDVLFHYKNGKKATKFKTIYLMEIKEGKQIKRWLI